MSCVAMDVRGNVDQAHIDQALCSLLSLRCQVLTIIRWFLSVSDEIDSIGYLRRVGFRNCAEDSCEKINTGIASVS